jgi:ferredoxin like protein
VSGLEALEVGAVPERLARNRYTLDEDESHIRVDQDAVRAAGCAETIARCCPARVYTPTADGGLEVEYAACLECGTCLAVAPPGTLAWHYPRGGFGVSFREG